MNYQLGRLLRTSLSLLVIMSWSTFIDASPVKVDTTVEQTNGSLTLKKQITFSPAQCLFVDYQYSPDKSRHAAMRKGTIEISDAETQKVFRTIHLQSRPQTGRAKFWFDLTGNKIIIASEYAVDIYDIESGNYAATFSKNYESIIAASTNSARNRIFVIDTSGQAYLLEIDQNDTRSSLHQLTEENFDCTPMVYFWGNMVLVHTGLTYQMIDISSDTPTFLNVKIEDLL